jgi:hypothetical protein
MVHFSVFPVLALYAFCLSNTIFALPTSRFTHDLQNLPTRDLQENQHTSAAAPTHRLRKRGLPGAVYICTSDNFRGACAWTAPNSRCHIAGTGNNSARSIGPDEDGFCVLFEKATCTGAQVKTLRYPGQASDMPAFMSLKCYSDGNGMRANATAVASGSAKVESSILAGADPRLAGGVGSMERKNLEDVMEQMEKDGFRQGMIGLKKGHYY